MVLNHLSTFEGIVLATRQRELLKKIRNVSYFNKASITPIDNVSTFSKINITPDKPFKVQGRLIGAGVFDDEKYGKLEITPEELKDSLHLWKGINLFKHHGAFKAIADGVDSTIDDVVGVITDVMWNAKEQAIDYIGEIFDNNVAVKIAANLIKFVSVGFARDIFKVDDEFFVKNIEPKETSLVFNPRYKEASILPA